MEGGQVAGLGVKIGQLASDLAAARDELTKLRNNPPPVQEGQPRPLPSAGQNKGSRPAGQQSNTRRGTRTRGTQARPNVVATGTQTLQEVEDLEALSEDEPTREIETQTDGGPMAAPTAVPSNRDAGVQVDEIPNGLRPLPPSGPFNALPPGTAADTLRSTPRNSLIAYHTRARGNEVVPFDDDGFATADEDEGPGGRIAGAVGDAARSAGALTGNLVAGTLATAGSVAGSIAGGVARGTARGIVNAAGALGRQIMGGGGGAQQVEGLLEDAPLENNPRIEEVFDDPLQIEAGAPQLQLEWYPQDGQPDQQLNANVQVVQGGGMSVADRRAVEEGTQFRRRRGRGSAEGPRSTRAARRRRRHN